MRLDVRLTHRFLDKLWCQAVVAFLFVDDSPQKGYLSKINEILAGSLTPLIERRFITGKRDELILIAPQERIKADKLLFLGLGPISSYSARILRTVMRKLSSTLDKLHVNEFGIMVPCLEKTKTDYKAFIQNMIDILVDYYGKSKEDAFDFSITIYVSIEEKFFSDLQSLEQSLRRYMNPLMEYSIVIDDSRGSGDEKV